MENEKTITGEELIKKVEEQTPKVMDEVHKLLETLAKDGGYHIMAITDAIARIADQFHMGYERGYDAGRLEQVEDSIKLFERVRDKLLGLDTEEEDDEEEEDEQ